MIDRLLTIVGLDSNATNVKLHDCPAISMLYDHPTAPPRTQTWNYRSAVGCLSYIQAIVRPDITMAVQQCARFCNQPNKDHEEAVKRICRYLFKTRSQGLVLKPDKSKGLECHVDADFAGTWTHLSAGDPLSCHSRTAALSFHMLVVPSCGKAKFNLSLLYPPQRPNTSLFLRLYVRSLPSSNY